MDSDELINLNRLYPEARFPSVWDSINRLAGEGRLIAPQEVRKEVLRGDDELVAWTRAHPQVFQPLDEQQQGAVAEVLRDFPYLAGATGERPQADAFVIALAKIRISSLFSQRCAVIAADKAVRSVCRALGIECLRLLDLFERENWTF
jgi:hypothetical protein